jgi:hypothetical protein
MLVVCSNFWLVLISRHNQKLGTKLTRVSIVVLYAKRHAAALWCVPIQALVCIRMRGCWAVMCMGEAAHGPLAECVLCVCAKVW